MSDSIIDLVIISIIFIIILFLLTTVAMCAVCRFGAERRGTLDDD